MAVLEDIWAMSRDRLDIDEFLLRHGFHGPAEGELSSRVWREDPAPVLALVAAYRNKDDSDVRTDAPHGQPRPSRGSAATGSCPPARPTICTIPLGGGDPNQTAG